ncbi:hypothetical protein PYCCODRAFT_701883 [Trametes coccinea BRFM310]|uniref:Secreted protein n=1 Tax=Trametes coccinea (strain BRFM310) TaxID=1353009 RepID=A0A1Y2IGY5_TRAC3|nr:hypothetical protein PYCCODRAFT_701883 [Trametes coccinea BRFM310]
MSVAVLPLILPGFCLGSDPNHSFASPPYVLPATSRASSRLHVSHSRMSLVEKRIAAPNHDDLRGGVLKHRVPIHRSKSNRCQRSDLASRGLVSEAIKGDTLSFDSPRRLRVSTHGRTSHTVHRNAHPLGSHLCGRARLVDAPPGGVGQTHAASRSGDHPASCGARPVAAACEGRSAGHDPHRGLSVQRGVLPAGSYAPGHPGLVHLAPRHLAYFGPAADPDARSACWLAL